jgi:hypothetical protein
VFNGSAAKQTRKQGKRTSMKTLHGFPTTLVAGLLMSDMVLAQSDINEREARYQRGITDGVKNGELTPQQARKLEKEQAWIRAQGAKAKSDGDSLLKGALRFKKRQDKTSRQIHKEKHDNQQRK